MGLLRWLRGERGGITGTAIGSLVVTGGVLGGLVVSGVIGGGGSGFTCDSTLTSGQNVVTAVTNATGVSTICLGAGSYSFNANISKASITTVRAAPGLTKSQVTFTTLAMQSSNNLTFQTFTCTSCGDIGGGSLNTAAHNITYRDFTAGSQLCINATSNGPLNITIDGGLFGNTPGSGATSGCGEARLQVNGWNRATYTVDQNIVVKNTEFGPNGGYDGVGTTGGSHGITVGPGNYFHDITQAFCDGVAGTPHCDSVQPYAQTGPFRIIGNYFRDNTHSVGDFDCDVVNEFTDNVIYDGSSADTDSTFSGLTSGTLIAHNTGGSSESDLRVYGGNCGGTNNGVTVRDNVFRGGVTVINCTGCTNTNNSTTATFVGGASPATWADFALTSPLGTATDGGNIGARFACAPGAC